jgi:hydrogenase/urease accessory protein HupE
MKRGLMRSLLLLLLAGPAPALLAHEVRPAFLDLREQAPGRVELLWKVPAQQGMRLAIHPVLPDDWRDVSAPRLEEARDAVIERRTLAVGAQGLEKGRIAFEGQELTIVDVLVRTERGDGSVSTTIVRPGRPWVDLAMARTGPLQYLSLGFEHIVLGFDHLLFVLGLLLIVPNRWMLLETITSFTVAHSITLGLATLGYVNAPVALVDVAIALSILFLGPEIVRFRRGGTSLTIRHPWLVAFLFGLLHGCGFASGLTLIGLPRAEIPLALLNFNVGVEIGQLAFVLLVLAVARSLRQLEIRWPRWALALPGYAVGSLGAMWAIEYTATLLGSWP